MLASPRRRPVPGRPWASLRFRDFRLIWTAAVLGGISDQVRRAADLWLVYPLSGGSPLQLRFIRLFQAAPLFVSACWMARSRTC